MSAKTQKSPQGRLTKKRSLLSIDPGFTIKTHRTLLLLALAALAMKSVIFEPIGWWPFVFVCLVPWVILVGAASHAPRVYFHSWLFGLAFFLLNMRWLYPATGPGYATLALYLSVYFPFMACVLRHIVRRRHWPLALALPVVWVGGEMLRAVVISGFPWFFLSHSLYEVLPLIQISDLVGAYGVSFVAAAVNGAVADIALRVVAARREPTIAFRWRDCRTSVAVAVVLVASALAYGTYQLQRDTIEDGPRVALIQGDFVMSVYGEEASDAEKFHTYLEMIDAASEQEPDLYVLPETPWRMHLNPEARELSRSSRIAHQALQDRATRDGAYIVVGSASREERPYDLLAPMRMFNSASVIRPEGGEVGRYDKVHLVYFGEIVPFRFGRLRFLYLWLNRIMPFSEGGTYEYSLFPGSGFHHFEMTPRSQPARRYRFGTPICYEDVMPYVSRRFATGDGESDGKQVDFLLNISNDGWFGRGNQQPQHLAISVFRAVENRVGLARSVNTGVSAVIDPDGRISNVVEPDASNPWPRACNYSVGTLRVDPRFTLYSRFGDWFGWACAACCLILFVDYWIARARTHGLAIDDVGINAKKTTQTK